MVSLDEKLNRMKCEIAAEFGIPDYDKIDKGELSARINGKIGGEMVRRLVEMGKRQLEMEEHRELIKIDTKEILNQKVIALPLPKPIEQQWENDSYFPHEYLQ